MRERLLLVDFNNILMRGMSVHDGLTDRKGNFTGGLYGFFQILCKTISTQNITHIAICHDHPPYVRHYEAANYKGGRDQGDPEGYALMKQLRKQSEKQIAGALKLLNWPQIKMEGFEADDLISGIVVNDYDKFEQLIISSNDSDLVQCLDEACKIRILKKNGTVLYDYRSLMQDYDNLPMEKIMMAHAIMGTHNNVPGIAGYGPVKALQAVKVGRKIVELNERYEGLIDRNLKLIKLPHEALRLKPVSYTGRYTYKQLLYYFDDFDMKVTSAMDAAFQQLAQRTR